jgi:hypothetical protein
VQRRSYLSIQFIGIPSDTLYGIALGLWLLSGLVVLHPRTEELIASKFHHLRPPSALEMQLLARSVSAVTAGSSTHLPAGQARHEHGNTKRLTRRQSSDHASAQLESPGS